jgi:hypothetical protein
MLLSSTLCVYVLCACTCWLLPALAHAQQLPAQANTGLRTWGSSLSLPLPLPLSLQPQYPGPPPPCPADSLPYGLDSNHGVCKYSGATGNCA